MDNRGPDGAESASIGRSLPIHGMLLRPGVEATDLDGDGLEYVWRVDGVAASPSGPCYVFADGQGGVLG